MGRWMLIAGALSVACGSSDPTDPKTDTDTTTPATDDTDADAPSGDTDPTPTPVPDTDLPDDTADTPELGIRMRLPFAALPVGEDGLVRGRVFSIVSTWPTVIVSRPAPCELAPAATLVA